VAVAEPGRTPGIATPVRFKLVANVDRVDKWSEA